MPLAFRVFFEGIRDCDCPVAQVLAVHGLDGGIGCLETCEVDESETFRVACVGVALDLKIKLILISENRFLASFQVWHRLGKKL